MFVQNLYQQSHEWIKEYPYLFEVAKVLFVSLIAVVGFFATRLVFLKIVRRLVKRDKKNIVGVLISDRLLKNLSYIAPLLIIHTFSFLFNILDEFINAITDALIVVAILAALNFFINSITFLLEKKPKFENQPLKSYGQVIKIFLFVFGIVIILGIVTGKSPWALMGGLSAMTAVLLLIFKDTILSFVASLQISTYDLVKIGDWIEVPQFSADGDVIEVSLNVVKVQNWDKTITSIPTYKLIDNSFKNWRGMQNSGGRRISRALNIDVNSIKFCDDALMNKIGQIQVLDKYINQKLKELNQWNKDNNIDDSVPVNGRRMTNIGMFRAYIKAYLKDREDINKNLTFLVRQLAPNEYGIPIQIYIFTATTEWIAYEGIQADIFDHIMAVVSYFDLKIYQAPAGNDFKSLQINNEAGKPALRSFHSESVRNPEFGTS